MISSARALSFSAAIVAVFAISGCSGPPQPAPEPTGEEQQQAWRVVAGDSPLEQTLAQLYSIALTAHGQPSVVQTEAEATALAAELVLDEESDDPEDHVEMVILPILGLAEEFMHEESELEEFNPEEPEEAENDEFTQQDPDAALETTNEFLRGDAQLYATQASDQDVLVVTSATLAAIEFDGDPAPTLSELESECPEWSIGHTSAAEASAEKLEEDLNCELSQESIETEEDLLDQLITDDIDAAVLSASHPGIEENALVVFDEEGSLMGEDRYVAVLSSRVAEESPAVIGEISEQLDAEAVVLLRNLLYGPEALDPEEAAEYWLVEKGLVAEPEGWG